MQLGTVRFLGLEFTLYERRHRVRVGIVDEDGEFSGGCWRLSGAESHKGTEEELVGYVQNPLETLQGREGGRFRTGAGEDVMELAKEEILPRLAKLLGRVGQKSMKCGACGYKFCGQ